MAYVPAPPPGGPPRGAAPEPSAAAAAGAAAAALLQRQLAEEPRSGDKPNGGWTEHQTGDGRKFFFHEQTQTSSWEKPEVLMTPEERKNDTVWREYRIWDGRVFYHNSETKVSCWSMPPEIRRLRGESSGIDETPLPQTTAERRKAYWDHLRERGVDDTWTWAKAEEAVGGDPQARDLDVQTRKQCFAELIGLCLRQKQIEAREKQRNAANALERLIEERFGNPEDLATSYEEAASLLEHEEPWQLIKSDVRRDEVFQTVMERLEEKHQKARSEKRSEQTIRVQRLMATDAELKRPRLRWKDAAAILEKRDELHEEDPPLEALRVWSSLRDLKPASEHEQEVKRRAQPDAIYRDERKRRDTFVDILREMATKDSFAKDTPWSDFEGLVKSHSALLGLQGGPGATAMELFDEFQEEVCRGVPPAEAGLGFEIDLAMPAESMPPVVAAPAFGAALDASGRPGVVKTEARLGAVKNEVGEPAAKRARLEPGAPPPPPLQPGMVRTKQEMMAPKASGLLAAKTEAEPSPLDQLLAAADAYGDPVPGLPSQQAVSTPLTKEEVLEPSAKSQPKAPGMVKEELAEAPAAPKRVMAPKKAPAPKTEETNEGEATSGAMAVGHTSGETFTAAQLMGKKVDDLRELCRERGLQVSGRKQELVDRLKSD